MLAWLQSSDGRTSPVARFCAVLPGQRSRQKCCKKAWPKSGSAGTRRYLRAAGTFRFSAEYSAPGNVNRRFEAPPTRPERLLVASAQGDFHVFSPLLLTYLLRRRGWDVIYLGANVPTVELAAQLTRCNRTSSFWPRSCSTRPPPCLKWRMTWWVRTQWLPMAVWCSILNPELKQRVPAISRPHLNGAIDHSRGAAAQQAARSCRHRRADPAFASALAQFNERRALIESHVWGTMVADHEPTDDLAEINTNWPRSSRPY